MTTATLLSRETLRIKMPTSLMPLLADEAKIGPRSLLLASARVVMWGARARDRGWQVELPVQDVEEVLTALRRASQRMLDESTSASIREHGRVAGTRIDGIVRKITRQGWTVSETDAGVILSTTEMEC